MKHSFPLAIAASLAALVGIAGCTSPDTGDDPRVLTVAQYSAGTFDIVASGYPGPFMSHAVYDYLFTVGPGREIQPSLATEWSYNDDKTELSITIRTDVIDSAGDPYDAEALKQFIDAVLEGPRAAIWPGVSAVDVVDSDTVVLRLSSYDPSVLINNTFHPVGAPAMIGAADAGTRPVGTGPYELDESRTTDGVEYVLVKRDDSWNAEAYPYDEIVVKILEDEVARLNALKAGQVDIAAINPGSVTEAESSGFELLALTNAWWGLELDVTGANNPALADPRVREAIALAFDREAINDILYSGYGEPSNQPYFTSTSAFYLADREGEFAFDPERARELLADAGYPDGFTLDLPSIGNAGSYITGFFDSDFQPLVEGSLADIGITVNFEPRTADFVEHMTNAAAGDGIIMYMLQDDTFLDLNVEADGFYNPWKTVKPEIDSLIGTWRSGTATDAERVAAAQELGEYLLDEHGAIGVMRIPAFWAYDPEIEIGGASDETYDIEPFLRWIRPAE